MALIPENVLKLISDTESEQIEVPIAFSYSSIFMLLVFLFNWTTGLNKWRFNDFWFLLVFVIYIRNSSISISIASINSRV